MGWIHSYLIEEGKLALLHLIGKFKTLNVPDGKTLVKKDKELDLLRLGNSTWLAKKLVKALALL